MKAMKDFSPEARARFIEARKNIQAKKMTESEIKKMESRNRTPRNLSVDEIEEIRLNERMSQRPSSMR